MNRDDDSRCYEFVQTLSSNEWLCFDRNYWHY